MLSHSSSRPLLRMPCMRKASFLAGWHQGLAVRFLAPWFIACSGAAFLGLGGMTANREIQVLIQYLLLLLIASINTIFLARDGRFVRPGVGILAFYVLVGRVLCWSRLLF